MSYLYTSLPVSRNVSTSQEFIDNKNPNEMSCPVGHTNINPIPITSRLSYSAVKDNLGTAAAAVILQKDIPLCEAGLSPLKRGILQFMPYSSSRKRVEQWRSMKMKICLRKYVRIYENCTLVCTNISNYDSCQYP